MNEIKRAMLGDKESQIMVTERDKLLPCPFCGGKAEIGQDADSDDFKRWNVVFCTKCYAEIKGKDTIGKIDKDEEKELIKQWNTRTQILID